MEARGIADSMALKLRHHNEVLHSRHAPSEPSARACYDAVELVRYEALGSNNYAGIRGNLDAATGAQIIDLMFELNAEQGTTLILVTHDEALARRCGCTLRLSAGELT